MAGLFFVLVLRSSIQLSRIQLVSKSPPHQNGAYPQVGNFFICLKKARARAPDLP